MAPEKLEASMPTLPFGCFLKATPMKDRLSEWGIWSVEPVNLGASLPAKLTSFVQVGSPTCKMKMATVPTSQGWCENEARWKCLAGWLTQMKSLNRCYIHTEFGLVFYSLLLEFFNSPKKK